MKLSELLAQYHLALKQYYMALQAYNRTEQLINHLEDLIAHYGGSSGKEAVAEEARKVRMEINREIQAMQQRFRGTE